MVIGLAKEAVAELIGDKSSDFQLCCKKFSIHLLMKKNTVCSELLLATF